MLRGARTLGISAHRPVFIRQAQNPVTIEGSEQIHASGGASHFQSAKVDYGYPIYPGGAVNPQLPVGFSDYAQAQSGALLFPTEADYHADETVENKLIVAADPEDEIVRLRNTVPENETQRQEIHERLRELNSSEPAKVVPFQSPTNQAVKGPRYNQIFHGPPDLAEYVAGFTAQQRRDAAEEMHNFFPYLIKRSNAAPWYEAPKVIPMSTLTVPEFKQASMVGPKRNPETFPILDERPYDTIGDSVSNAVLLTERTEPTVLEHLRKMLSVGEPPEMANGENVSVPKPAPVKRKRAPRRKKAAAGGALDDDEDEDMTGEQDDTMDIDPRALTDPIPDSDTEEAMTVEDETPETALAIVPTQQTASPDLPAGITVQDEYIDDVMQFAPVAGPSASQMDINSVLRTLPANVLGTDIGHPLVGTVNVGQVEENQVRTAQLERVANVTQVIVPRGTVDEAASGHAPLRALGYGNAPEAGNLVGATIKFAESIKALMAKYNTVRAEFTAAKNTTSNYDYKGAAEGLSTELNSILAEYTTAAREAETDTFSARQILADAANVASTFSVVIKEMYNIVDQSAVWFRESANLTLAGVREALFTVEVRLRSMRSRALTHDNPTLGKRSYDEDDVEDANKTVRMTVGAVSDGNVVQPAGEVEPVPLVQNNLYHQINRQEQTSVQQNNLYQQNNVVVNVDNRAVEALQHTIQVQEHALAETMARALQVEERLNQAMSAGLQQQLENEKLRLEQRIAQQEREISARENELAKTREEVQRQQEMGQQELERRRQVDQLELENAQRALDYRALEITHQHTQNLVALQQNQQINQTIAVQAPTAVQPTVDAGEALAAMQQLAEASTQNTQAILQQVREIESAQRNDPSTAELLVQQLVGSVVETNKLARELVSRADVQDTAAPGPDLTAPFVEALRRIPISLQEVNAAITANTSAVNRAATHAANRPDAVEPIAVDLLNRNPLLPPDVLDKLAKFLTAKTTKKPQIPYLMPALKGKRNTQETKQMKDIKKKRITGALTNADALVVKEQDFSITAKPKRKFQNTIEELDDASLL
jgi:hypothetical protein